MTNLTKIVDGIAIQCSDEETELNAVFLGSE